MAAVAWHFSAPARPAHANESPGTAPLLVRDRNPDCDRSEGATPMTTAATARETENPYLNGNYAPVREEITAIDLDVSGTIPDYLDGRYLRIGPNPMGDPDPARYQFALGAGNVPRHPGGEGHQGCRYQCAQGQRLPQDRDRPAPNPFRWLCGASPARPEGGSGRARTHREAIWLQWRPHQRAHTGEVPRPPTLTSCGSGR